MNNGRTVFSQLVEELPHKDFQKCVSRYRGDHYVKKFSCWDQFLRMAFAQLTYRDGLRDIEACLQSVGSKLYHMGFRSKIKRSTLADANELRDWRIYADFAQILIAIAARCMRMIRSASNSIRVSMRWIRRRSIYACRFFHGRSFAGIKPQSKCIRCSICTGTFQHSSGLPMVRSMTSTFSMRFFPKLAPSTSWTVATSLHRFRTSLHFRTFFRLLCRTHQRQCSAATALCSRKSPFCRYFNHPTTNPTRCQT